VIVYFETSAFVKVLIEEAGSDAAKVSWDEADTIVSSVLTYAEARAALAAARRLGRLTPGGLREAKDSLEFRWGQIEVLAVDEDVVRSAGALAERHALRGYDALHLASCVEVAGEHGFVVATSDGELVRAAGREGLQVIRP
jgi:predicted nucleic acid-binding protein